uniref:Uncharacterized protein n=1 Tax=Setaria viridis TaxID=4556 RepID=A0A4U6W7K3_SETVI|nr:hypothetical protein SEVIR_1G113825v2 [Setaria viridis]
MIYDFKTARMLINPKTWSSFEPATTAILVAMHDATAAAYSRGYKTIHPGTITKQSLVFVRGKLNTSKLKDCT